jgi:hypothetical protein
MLDDCNIYLFRRLVGRCDPGRQQLEARWKRLVASIMQDVSGTQVTDELIVFIAGLGDEL